MSTGTRAILSMIIPVTVTVIVATYLLSKYLVYPTVTNKTARKSPLPNRKFDSCVVGKITNASIFNKYDLKLSVQYTVNGQIYEVRLNGHTTPSSFYLADEVLGARSSTLLLQFRGAALQGKEVYVYFDNDSPQVCYVSPHKDDGLMKG